MTSLQKQLAVIAATSSHELDLKAQKAAHAKSLLFAESVAASQDFDTIYQLCYEGFQELCALDTRFLIFAKNLFSEQSKSENRNHKTSKENEQLDLVIQSFLGLVGARLLLKPGVKAVEWLVRRFRVHEFNTEQIILTFLPYHTTPLFLTLLSILPRQIPRTFRFLYPYMTSLAPIPRQVIVYTAANTRSFFLALNQHVLNTVREWQHYPALLSFWVSVITQALNGMLDAALSGRSAIQNERMEDVLLAILPVLNDAFAIQNVRELTLASCMIITVLVSKATLEDNVVIILMETIVESYSSQSMGPCLAALASLACTRSDLRLPSSVYGRLLKNIDLAEHLSSLSRRYPIGRLSLGLILGAVEQITEAEASKISPQVARVLQAGLLNEAQLTIFVESVLLRVKPFDANSGTQLQHRNSLATLIQWLHNAPSSARIIEKAAEKHGIDMVTLEGKLNLALRAPASDQTHVNGSTDANAVEIVPMTEIFDADPTKLVQRISENGSFLAEVRMARFEELANIFIRSASSPEQLERFMNEASSSDVTAGEDSLPIVTFLLRLASLPYSTFARSAALIIIARWLARLDAITYLVQALIPYLVSALADQSTSVRRASADCISALLHLYEQQHVNKRGPQDEKPLGSQSIYGANSEGLYWLAIDEAHQILSNVLSPAIEECILDGENIGRTIRSAVQGPRRSRASKGRIGGAEVKSTVKNSICTFLSTHISKSPVLTVRSRILSMLTGIGKSGTASRAHVLLPLVRQWVSLTYNEASSLCASENLTISTVDYTHVATISCHEAEGISLLQDLMADSNEDRRSSVGEAAFKHLRDIWTSLSQHDQCSLAQFLVHTSVGSLESEVEETRRTGALEALRTLQLSTDVLKSLLEALPAAHQLPDKPPANKRRRFSRSEQAKFSGPDVEKASISLKEYTVVLELISSSNPARHPELLKGLFHSLSEIHRFKLLIGSELAYLQELVIQSLLSIVAKVKGTPDATIEHTSIRTDLLVDCARNTSEPQVQRAAILLISTLATWVPELVLHSVMPIFTFMSSSVLRQNDEYSAHVVDQTLATVVPGLASSLREQRKNLVVGVSELLLSFTAAFEHIPLHRRLRLFRQLATTLGPDDSLFAMIAMLVDRYPTENQVYQFIAVLVNEFEPSIGLQAMTKYVDLLIEAMQAKGVLFESIFNFSEKIEDQKEKVLTNLLSALCHLLFNESFRERIAQALRSGGSIAASVQSVYANLLERGIKLSAAASSRTHLHRSCGDAFRSILELLPLEDFLESAEKLLEHPQVEVRHKVFTSIESQLRRIGHMDRAPRTSMLNLLSKLSHSLELSRDALSNLTLLSCIDQLSDKYGRRDRQLLTEVTHIVGGPAALGSEDDRLRVMSLLCLASSVEILQEEIIPLVPQVLPQACHYLSHSLQAPKPKMPLHNAVYAFMMALIDHTPFVLSSQDLDNLLRLSHKSASTGFGQEAVDHRNQFLKLLSQKLEPKDCFGAIERTVTDAVTAGHTALLEHLQTLRHAIEICSKASTVRNSQSLFNTLLNLFDLRRLREENALSQKYSNDQIDEIEALSTQTALEMIMKLNDATFRPFFIRLVQWTSNGLSKKDLQGQMRRKICLFKFVQVFSEALKSIVTGYASYLLDPARTALEAPPSEEAVSIELRKQVLLALESSFRHDQDGFWQAPNNFDSLASPLIDQLTHAKSLTIDERVFSAIVGLAVAASSADHHKEMNSRILKLMRSGEARVRLAAVRCEHKLTERLGEEWLSLLPEMLPFISELQEDEDEQVEQETLRWIRRIEDTLGERLDAMLQ